MTTETPYIIVQVSVGSLEEATTLASIVVERNLAACAQCFPIRSLYTWQGKVETADEHLLLFKTRCDRYSALEACIKEQHSYDVPEIMAIPIVAGSSAYLAWIDEVVPKLD
jgi:periplasmic divalent cation tolerance protein